MALITIVTASSGKNLELAHKFETELKLLGAEVEILDIAVLELPLYHAGTDSKNDAKALLGPWGDKLQNSKSFVFLAPEYNGGIPPLFTNFIAWVSRSTKDWRECFNGKSAVLGTFSAGNGQLVLGALRTQLSFIGLNVLGRQILTTFAKPLEEESLKAVCRELVKHSTL